MRAHEYTRRRLLTHVAPGLALATLLPACGQPSGSATTTASVQGSPPTGAIAASGRAPRATSPLFPSGTRSPAAPTAILPTPTPTLSAAAPGFLGDAGCSTAYQPNRKPGDPYTWELASEGAAIPFAEKVRRYAQLIVVGTVRDILPSRWVTPDGHRPANPHTNNGLLIITPMRVQVERVAKGKYNLPDIYLAASGGRIGADCASYSGSGPRPRFRFGERSFYFLDPFTEPIPGPVPAESQYRYFRPNYSYTVQPDGTVRIGPESDIMGKRVDDPPHTLTVDEAIREIAALLACPQATPTR